MSDVEPDDTAQELLGLYKALRVTPDGKVRAAIKERIDFLIEQSFRTFQSQRVGEAHSPKLDS